MDQRAINAYQKNAIMTASKAELTLMLYDGAIKFCNIALSGFEKKEYEKINTNLKKSTGDYYRVSCHAGLQISGLGRF